MLSFRYAFSCLVLLLLFLPVAATATDPVSIGFADPDDTRTLLDYRLPDWGYRTWDLRADFNGSGSRNQNKESIRNRIAGNLMSIVSLHRENEERTWNLLLDTRGSYARNHDGNPSAVARSRDIRASARVLAGSTRYLGDGPISAGLSGSYNRSYHEDRDTRTGSNGFDDTDIARAGTGDVYLNLGVGRIRDVTPLVRASRLSERLVALGRSPLSPDQIRRVAEVLAIENGYRTVFDRPDRRFWNDVLEPAIADQEPLSPFEVHYLMEVLQEDIGSRRQGWRIALGSFYREANRTHGVTNTVDVDRGLRLSLAWARHLNLDHQVSVDAWLNYDWDRHASYLSGEGDFNLVVHHLWSIADRYRLDTGAGAHGSYIEKDEEFVGRQIFGDLTSVLKVFLEDALSLDVSVGGSYSWTANADPDFETTRWSWNYGLGLSYRLDGILY